MTVALNLLLAALLIATGYIFVCYYLNGVKWNSKNFEVLRFSRNKIFYILIAVFSAVGLICVFNSVHNLALLQSTKLLCLTMLLFPIAAIDLRIQKIPNQLILAAIAIRCLMYIPEFIISSSNAAAVLKDNLLGMAVIGAFFFFAFIGF